MEHTVGIYILLIGISCLVGIATKLLTHLPYTIALVLVGLGLAIFDIGIDIHQIGFSKEFIFFILLPPLLFQGSLHMQLDRLKRHLFLIIFFATIGVLATTFIIGYFTYYMGAFASLPIAMLFGALICTTDPVSVLAIFRQAGVSPDLKYLVEGESLFNDGTGVVIFGIILALVTSPQQGGFQWLDAVLQFIKVSFGGAIIGLLIGYLTYQVLRRLTDHLLENTICLVACYSSFWLAEHFHFSGVIAVVFVGLLIGNYGRQFAMSSKTTETVETFFESFDFLINSLLFILIGLELQAIKGELRFSEDLSPILIGIVAVIIGRLVIYPFFFALRKFGGKDSTGQRMNYPNAWSHILFWGGLKGSIPIALLLGLKGQLAQSDYHIVLVVGFAVVCFSLIVQGLTIQPLIKLLKLSADKKELKEDPAHSQEGLK